MRDYAELVKALRGFDIGNSCPCETPDMCNDNDCMVCQAADAIEELQAKNDKQTMMIRKRSERIKELLAELERYRHAAFVIGETCVDESKCHISPEDAIKKIRENIYYSRQMPLPEPPKEVNDEV